LERPQIFSQEDQKGRRFVGLRSGRRRSFSIRHGRESVVSNPKILAF
jgi:hypothetical protein